MSKDNSNQPAFPMLDMNNVEGRPVLQLRYEGLTKQEYFAGLAMQGLLSNSESLKEIRKESGDNWDKYHKLVSVFCINQADELLKQLSNE